MAGAYRSLCCCGKAFRASEGRDRSCASDPGARCSTSIELEEALYDDHLVTRSISECHPASVNVNGRTEWFTRPEMNVMGQVPVNCAGGENSSCAQYQKSLLSLDVSGIAFSDTEMEAILQNQPKLVALAVSTGAAANTGMRAATELCDLRHLDISFLGFSCPEGGTFTSNATKATTLSETLTALCNAAAKRSTARVQVSESSVDHSEQAMAGLCDAAPWWRSSSSSAAGPGACAAGIPHATVEPSATFHLAIDLQLLIAFSRAWLRDSFSSIPNRALTIRHHASGGMSLGASCSHTNPVHSLVAAVSPEPSRILHVLLPEVIVGPARLSHFELCGVETTESLLRHLLRLETPPLSALRLLNCDPDRPTATSSSAEAANDDCADGVTATSASMPSSPCESYMEPEHTGKKAKLDEGRAREPSSLHCSGSAFDVEEPQQQHSAPLHRAATEDTAVSSHPLSASRTSAVAPAAGSWADGHPELVNVCSATDATLACCADASTSRGKRRGSDEVGRRSAGDIHRATRRTAVHAQGAGGGSEPRRSTLQSVLLAARWRRPSSAILRQIIDAHGAGLQSLHLRDLAGVNDTVMRRLRSHAVSLRSLTLSGTCPVTVEGIKELGFMPLSSLHLCRLPDPLVGQQALELLSKANTGIAGSLQELSLEGFMLDCAQLKCLPLLARLRLLSLNHTLLADVPPEHGSSCGVCGCSSFDQRAAKLPGRCLAVDMESTGGCPSEVPQQCSHAQEPSGSSSEATGRSFDNGRRTSLAPSCAGMHGSHMMPVGQSDAWEGVVDGRLDHVVGHILAMPTLQKLSVGGSNMSEAFCTAAARLQGQCRVEVGE